MRIGPLQKRVVFQKRFTTPNEFGETRDVWNPISEVWARIEPLAGREFFSALQTQSDLSARIVCRYSRALSEVTAQDRIVHGDIVYDIRHPPIDKDMKHRELHFMCTVHAE